MNLSDTVQYVLDIVQKVERVINVCFTTTPINYNNKKLEILEELFLVTNEYMKNTGATYWIDYGTLLGHYRQKGIIAHDVDIDFGAHEDEYKKIWEMRKSLPKGFKLYDTSFRHRGPKLYFNYKGFDADIYFYESNNEKLISYEDSSYPNERTPYAKELVLPVQSSQFLGQNTYIPAQPQKYLEHIYNYLGEGGRRDMTTGYWYPREN